MMLESSAVNRKLSLAVWHVENDSKGDHHNLQTKAKMDTEFCCWKESDRTKKLSTHTCMQSLPEKEKKKNAKLQRCAKRVNHRASPFLTLVLTEVAMTGESTLHLLPGSHKDTRSTLRSFQILFTNVGLPEAPDSETY